MVLATGSSTPESLLHRPLFDQTRRRLALWYTGAMGAIVLAAACGLYFFLAHQQLSEVDRDVDNLTRTMTSSIEAHDNGENDDWRPLRSKLANVPFLRSVRPLPSSSGYARWYTPDGGLRVVAGRPPVSAVHKPLAEGVATVEGDTAFREHTVAVSTEGRMLGYLQVGLSLEPAYQTLHRVLLTLTFGVPLTLATVGLAGWWLAGLAIVPIAQSYTRLQQFTADASHELRTPLAALRANAQAALKQPEIPVLIRERLEAIDRTSERMGSLVGDLLFLARSDNTGHASNSQHCKLGEIIGDLGEELAPLALAGGVTLYCLIPDTDAGLLAEPDQMYRLFTNLITNGIKYTPPGGQVMVELQTHPRQIIVVVRDTGIGIPEVHQPHIFERFYRVDSTRGRGVGGSGLGLAICQAIVQAHAGSLELTQSGPAGSTFTVRLPAGSVSAAATSEFSAPRSA